LVMNSGRVFFLKQVRDGSSGTFESEARGLEELRKAGAVWVPEVVAQGPDYLLLEWIVEGKESTDSSMEELGFQFAKLHHFSGEIFGFPEDNYLGDSPQSNSPSKNGSANWPTFYVENRLQFQAVLAVKNGYTTPELQNLLELLYKKIPDLLSGTEDKPSLLHGDLWCGNYLIDKNGRPWLIDPAVYYGHREADLAMTSLFGGFSKTFYSAYESAFPLVPGYPEREPLYQLYHLLNHLNLFGTGYYRQVISILKRYAG
ncbi:MAG TPA: fructosamine kinase, partial [Candidatus Lambdaproteobacteria bacterium]|nr:fructosamine kinase [Candidatus Lambdaproteobacteria bacterium]